MPLTVTRGIIIVTKNSYHEQNLDIVILIITEISVLINKTNKFQFEFDKDSIPDFYTECSDVCAGGQTYGTTLGFSI